MAHRSLPKRVWYDFLHVVFRISAVLVFRIRCSGREHMPRTGGALVLCNHQSHLDPILVGLASDRRMNYLAKKSLFRFAPFRWLINSLDAIPIDRDGGGLAGLRETLKRLKAEEVVLIFPEGTRSTDGQMSPLKPGFCTLARRGKVPLVPMAIEGAWHSWPRDRRLPRTAVIQIEIGPPLMPEQLTDWSDEQLLAEVERRMRDCHALAKKKREHALRQKAKKGDDVTADGSTTETVVEVRDGGIRL